MSSKPRGNHDVSLTPGGNRGAAALAGRQHGVVSRGQLGELGLNRDAIARRVASGFLQPLHGGRVYSVGAAPLTRRGLYLAAVLACGAGAALSHRSAADLWGLRPSAARLEVTVSRGGRRLPGITTHPTRMLDPRDFTVEHGIRVTTIARTLLDLAAVLAPNDLLVAIDRAERLRILDLAAVNELLLRARGRRGARALGRAIAAYRPSTQKSELERRFRELIERTADIPHPSFNALTQAETGAHEVDALWQQHRLAVQLDGFAFHHTRRDKERDAATDADLELAGYQVLRLTWDDVTINAERALRRLRMRLGARAPRGAA